MGLVNLLLYLREVILQDAAILQEKFPESPVWSHPVFRHEAYPPFKQQVLAFIEEEERPSQLTRLTQAIPTLTDYLKSIDEWNEARFKQLEATNQHLTSLIEAGIPILTL